MTVYAPNVSSYTSHAPYITPAEFMASPTGVNVSQLVPRGTASQNDDALRTVIARASSYADTFCKQVLSSTVDIESGRYRIQRTGVMVIPMRNSPVVAVNSIKIGYSPSSMTEISDMGNVWIDRKVVQFPVNSLPLMPVFGGTSPDGKVYSIISYVNGYANAELSAPIVAGDLTATVSNPLGMYTGVELTVYDPGNTETLIVESFSGNTITFTSPATQAHEVGNNISSLPDSIKQAVVLLTASLIKTRGSEAIVMAQMRSQANQATSIEGGGSEEISIAKELLLPYVRTV